MLKELRSKYFWVGMCALMVSVGGVILFGLWKSNVVLQCLAVSIAFAGGLLNAWAELKQRVTQQNPSIERNAADSMVRLLTVSVFLWFVSNPTRRYQVLLLFWSIYFSAIVVGLYFKRLQAKGK